MIEAELTVAARKWAGLVAVKCALFRSDYLQRYNPQDGGDISGIDGQEEPADAQR